MTRAFRYDQLYYGFSNDHELMYDEEQCRESLLLPCTVFQTHCTILGIPIPIQ